MKKIHIMQLVIAFFVAFLNTGAASADLSTGLIAYFPFSGNANDASGNGNNGYVYGAQLTADRFGNPNSAYYFDGTGNLINIGHNPILKFGTQSYTISWWERINPGSVSQIISGGGKTDLNNSWYIERQPGYFVDRHFYNNTDQNDNAWQYLCADTDLWEQFILVRDVTKTELRLYLNGILRKTYSGIVTANINDYEDVWIGKDNRVHTNINSYTSGSLDNIRIYNRALSDSEAYQLYREEFINAQ